MNTKNILITFICFTLLSCGDNKTKNQKTVTKSPIEGYWNRIGTIQLVNGIPVDTILIKDSDNTDYKQVKVFKDGNMIWMNNQSDSLLPWEAGMGGYGKFKLNSLDSITEVNTNGTGWWGTAVKNYKDSLNVPGWTFGLKTNIEENIYSQKNNPNSNFAELWERMPDLQTETPFDGAWKRVYEISYVNGVAVDTTSVPNGSILDVKIFSNGYYTYHVDLTGFAEPDNPQYGGFGGHGTFEFNEEKNILTEYQEWGSGNNTQINDPRTSPDNHSITFYNDDLYLQISKTSVGVLEDTGATARGLVYKRIK